MSQEQEVHPRSQRAERAVLGSILRDNHTLADVQALLNADSFYEDAHQKIFRILVELIDANKVADMVTVGEALLQVKQVEDIGGLPYLYTLWESTPTAGNAVYYAEIVRDRAIKRKLIHAAENILAAGQAQAGTGDDLLAEAQHKLSLLADSQHADEPVHVSVAVAEAREQIEVRLAGGQGGITGIATGFTDLDKLTAGMQDGDLVMIGARPSTGKTALASSIAVYAALRDVPVLFISLEQRRRELAERMLCNVGRVSYKRLRDGTLTGEDIEAVNAATHALGQAPLTIEHTPALTVQRIKGIARQHQRKHGLKLLLIDYLQKMNPVGKSKDNREQQVADMVIGIKWLAQELSLPIVLLAQLNRKSVSENRRPRLEDFRETGSIEQEADVALLLHPEPDVGEPGQTGSMKVLTVIVAKQRNGETGDVRLMTRFDQMRLENYAWEVPIHRSPFDDRE